MRTLVRLTVVAALAGGTACLVKPSPPTAMRPAHPPVTILDARLRDETDAVIHGWHRAPPSLAARLPAGQQGGSGSVSVLDMSFDPHARLSASQLSLQMDGRPAAPCLAELLVDEHGAELSEPASLDRVRANLRQRVLFLFREPETIALETVVLVNGVPFGAVSRSDRELPVQLLAPMRVETLSVRRFGPRPDGSVLWGLLARITNPKDLPGVGPAAPRLVSGGWDAQPGHAFLLSTTPDLEELSALPPAGQPMLVLYLYRAGEQFEPEHLFLRDEAEQTRGLPKSDELGRLPPALVQRALEADVIHSGVP